MVPSSVFSASDLDLISSHLNIDLKAPQYETQRKRERFKRQLGAVSEFITFLVPQMDETGAVQVASDSMIFMRKLLDGSDEEEITLMIDSADDRSRIQFLSQAEAIAPTPPRDLVSEDLSLGGNLLELGMTKDGEEKLESPSSLETLMVSRLAWLLKRLKAEPLGWSSEGLDVMLLGTLAHQIFEDLFVFQKYTLCIFYNFSKDLLFLYIFLNYHMYLTNIP